MPGNVGGMAWGGEAFDPIHGLLILPLNRPVAEARLITSNQLHQRVVEEHRNLNGGWGGTLDPASRAFDVETGHELWQGKLPAGARSTPMTYKGRTASNTSSLAPAPGEFRNPPRWAAILWRFRSSQFTRAISL